MEGFIILIKIQLFLQNLRQLVALSTDMLCIKEDLYSEMNEFVGQQTLQNVFRYFEKGDKRMMVIYNEEAVPEIVKLIEKCDLPCGQHIKVYVFSPSEDPWAGEFDSVEDKVELCALPLAILNAYKRVLPKQHPVDVFVKPESVQEEIQTDGNSIFDNTKGGEA